MSITLSDLRTAVRRRADQENSRFISDAELDTYINAAYAELYDLLVSRFADYFLTNETFTLGGSTSSNSLPAGHYKTRGVDMQVNGEWISLPQWMFGERNANRRGLARLARGGISYRVAGGNLMFQPEGDTAGTFRHWYIPRYTPLVNGTDVLSGVLDFEEYIIVDGAIKCLIKEESDPSVLLAMKAALTQRIAAMAADRDAGEPQRVTDVAGTYDGFIDDPRFL